MKPRSLVLVLLLGGLGLPLLADEPRNNVKTHNVPYRMTTVKHVLVRAKINGKGPFNFILDTGAPALFVSTAAAKAVGVKPDARGWGTFERFEIEGGVVLKDARGVIEDPFQLEAMNGLGLAGAELHGVIGYNLLARFRIELDFTKTKMAWTPLNYDPPLPDRLGGGGSAPGGLDLIGSLVKMAGSFLKRPAPKLVPRGFYGLDLADDNLGVVIKSVFPNGPAARAGLMAGDRLLEFDGRTVRQGEDVLKYAGKVAVGEKAVLTVKRNEQTQDITITVGEGL
jgi:hypothetical protein